MNEGAQRCVVLSLYPHSPYYYYYYSVLLITEEEENIKFQPKTTTTTGPIRKRREEKRREEQSRAAQPSTRPLEQKITPRSGRRWRSITMTSVCPFAAKSARPDDASSCPRKSSGEEEEEENNNDNQNLKDQEEEKKKVSSATISPKCPFGYDTQTFKLGPFSCVICKALLFDSSKCVPCSHKYCKACISRFNDCPLCGADIETIQPDKDLQDVVDRFIEGHARIKRPQVNTDPKVVAESKVTYGDVSLERGAFLVQQAMRAFRAQNILSAKSRLSLCAEDIREQLVRLGNTSELCSQLGAVLGMLGDCCRAMGDASSAITYFEESVEFLLKLPTDDLELTHTLSVSLNKIGDLKYYDGDLQAARSYYARSLDVRRNAIKDCSNTPSQTLDVAVSLAKVADVDRSIGHEDVAVDGFQEAIKCLESLTLNSSDPLEQRRVSVLDYLRHQLTVDDQPTPSV